MRELTLCRISEKDFKAPIAWYYMVLVLHYTSVVRFDFDE